MSDITENSSALKTGKGTTAICPICGETFRRTAKNQKYCSRGCAGKAAGRKRAGQASNQRKRDADGYFHRVCQCCGKEFRAKSNTTKYCSDACRQKIRRTVYQPPKEPEVRICQGCGKEFVVKKCNQKYCCIQCAARHTDHRTHPDRQRGTPVRIRVLESLDVWEDMQPEVGKIYDAIETIGYQTETPTYLIPEIGRLGLLVKQGECEVVERGSVAEKQEGNNPRQLRCLPPEGARE